MGIYEWCAFCGQETCGIYSRQQKIVKIVYDECGQPIRYSQCYCGRLSGWVYMRHYEELGFEWWSEEFKTHIRTRISHFLAENGRL